MEAIVVCLDVGSGMDANNGDSEETYMDLARQFLLMALQRKIFAESKDEVALILFGTEETSNSLADQLGGYQHIRTERSLQLVDWLFVRQVETDIAATGFNADWFDAVVVGLDHLVSETEGKKVAAKSLILISAFDSPFVDDKVQTVVDSIKSLGVNLTVIGPEFLKSSQDSGDDQNENGRESPGVSAKKPTAAANHMTHLKAMTRHQKTAQAFITGMLNDVNGDHFSFTEALPLVNHMQTKNVRPTPWRANLQIGNELSIPICSYLKVKENKPKQSWKKAYGPDENEPLITERTHHLADENQTQIAKENIGRAYLYGTSQIAISKMDEAEHAKYQSEKCLHLLGFASRQEVSRWLYCGEDVRVVIPDNKVEGSAIALSAFIHGMFETDSVGLARYAYSKASNPRLVVLIPRIKVGRERLVMIQLPFSDDLRHYYFPSLEANKKFLPTDAQLKAVDELIDTLDLTHAEIDMSGDRTEALKPSRVLNPAIQRTFHCLQHRALYHDQPLPPIPPFLVRQLQTPPELQDLVKPVLVQMKQTFKLEVQEKKRKQTAADIFAANEEQKAKVVRPDTEDASQMDSGIAGLLRNDITKIGTVNPVEDFKQMLAQGVSGFDSAFGSLAEVTQKLVLNSFGTHTYSKAMDCIKALKSAAIEKSRSAMFNDFLKQLKETTTVTEKERRDFWLLLIKHRISLVSTDESPDSTVTPQEADEFIKEEEEEKPVKPADLSDEEDLMAQLE